MVAKPSARIAVPFTSYFKVIDGITLPGSVTEFLQAKKRGNNVSPFLLLDVTT
jgi:hypothetical protein